MPPFDATPTSATTPNQTAETLGDEIATLCSCIYAAEARLLDRLYQFDRDGCYESLGFHSTAHWLNYRCGIGMNAAREKVRVANALPGLPKIRDEFAAGKLSYSKVRAMTRVATPETEDYLLMIATHGTAHHVEKLVSLTRRCRRAEDEANAEAIYQGRELSVQYDDSGAMILKARFPAEQGALILKALGMALDMNVEERSEPGCEGQETSGDVTAETSKTNESVATVEKPERLPIGVRRADALVQLAETFLNHPENAGNTADRYQVVVHVTAETSELAATSEAHVTAVTPHIENGPRVTAETSRRIACDCSVVPVKDNLFGEPLSIGRKSRTIPAAIRRALRLRDGGCQFPGCTHTRFVDGHHIRHWADGGETSLENLVLLCRHHHVLVHEGGFGCQRTESGEIAFTDCRDRPISDGSPLPGIDVDLDAWLDKQIFEHDIDHDGCRAKMAAGEYMDWHMAVAAMM